jgi:hypothetical protein
MSQSADKSHRFRLVIELSIEWRSDKPSFGAVDPMKLVYQHLSSVGVSKWGRLEMLVLGANDGISSRQSHSSPCRVFHSSRTRYMNKIRPVK